MVASNTSRSRTRYRWPLAKQPRQPTAPAPRLPMRVARGETGWFGDRVVVSRDLLGRPA